MNALALSLFTFVALHSVPAIPSLRSRLISQFGRKTYLVVYSLISTVLMIFVLKAALATDYVELWPVASWQVLLTVLLSPLGLFLVIAGLISPNPLSVTLRDEASMGAITSITRHPVLWGFILWSFGHLAPNGDLRSLILFGGLGLFRGWPLHGRSPRPAKTGDGVADHGLNEFRLAAGSRDQRPHAIAHRHAIDRRPPSDHRSDRVAPGGRSYVAVRPGPAGDARLLGQTDRFSACSVCISF